MQTALRSSSDVQRGLSEALKVQELEELIGSIGGLVEREFKAFEKTAAERVRVAERYGLDVLAIEKRNADDRAKLAQQLAQAQTGSLQALVDELTSGSLAGGTAMDRIATLNGEIVKAKADLDANVEGAGDRLAQLFDRRLQAAEQAYGSTGGYADIRNDTVTASQAAIARVNRQIAEVQAGRGSGSDPALATTNAALDENNDQNARVIASLGRVEALLERGASGSSASFGGGFDLARRGSV